MPREISNMDDILDSRDIIKRIGELETELDDHAEAEEGSVLRLTDLEEQEKREELRILKNLEDQAAGYSDWTHGATLIRDSYFETYAQSYAEDIGAMENCDRWPATCIDWERAARELQMDYTSVEYDGVTYWIG